MVLTATLGLLYIAEELVWMKIGKGRPCKHCGQMIPVKAFRLASRVPTAENTPADSLSPDSLGE